MQTSNVVDLLQALGVRKIQVKGKHDGTWVNGCCPMHDERHPSFGVMVEEGLYNCYVCGSGNLLKLIMQVEDCTFKEAVMFLDKFDHTDWEDNKEARKLLFKKKEEEKEEKVAVDESELESLKSGLVYHDYMKNRGFSRDICRKFKMGWDAEQMRLTFPVFDREDNLHGFIRRAVLDEKFADGSDNPEYRSLYGFYPKYMLDDTIKKSELLYPLQHFCLGEDNSAILVEGQLDSWKMHSYGFSNTLSIINAKINAPQIKLLHSLGVEKIISMLDNDSAGRSGEERLLRNAKREFKIYTVEWPEGKKDPAELTKEEAGKMIAEAKFFMASKLKLRKDV